MNPPIHKPDEADADLLKGSSREAVDKIKAQPIPAESLNRSVERAKALNVASPYWARRRSILALAGIAAALLVGLLLLPNMGLERRNKEQAFELMTKSAGGGGDPSDVTDGTSNRVNTDAEDDSGSMFESLGKSRSPAPAIPNKFVEQDNLESQGRPNGSMGKDARKFTAEGLPELGAIVISSSNGGKGSGTGSGQGAGVSSGEGQDGKGLQRNQSFIDPIRGNGQPPGFPGGGLGLGGGGRPPGMGGMGGTGLNGGLGGLGGSPSGPLDQTGRTGFPGQNRGEDDNESRLRQPKSTTSIFRGTKDGESESAPRFADTYKSSSEQRDKDKKGLDGQQIGIITAPVEPELKKKLKEAEKSKAREDKFELGEAAIDQKLSRTDKGKDKNGKEGANETGASAKKPQVYRRRAARPAFARVYVGDQTSLELVSLQVTTTIEGPRARTVVDHIFRNPHDRQLEGTFEYPLPAGASPSYFAMFLGQTRETVPPRFNPKGQPESLPRASRFGQEFFSASPTQLVKSVSAADWGVLQEAHIVNKQKGLETYEEIVRGRIDPALLEYVGGNTFSGRVFPIPPKGYNRVLIAYEELLPASGDQVVYRYTLPDCPLTELEFHLQASPAECKDAHLSPKDASLEKSESRLLYSKTWKGEGPGGDVVFAFTPAQAQVQAISGRQTENSPLYLYARIKPELKVAKDKPFADRALFLLDTSLSEHPDRFAVNMMLLKKILESDKDLKHFNILTFNVGTAWVEPKGWLDNTPPGRETALARLDGLVLEGATDFNTALQQLAQPPAGEGLGDSKSPADVFVLSDGQITWGEHEVGPLVARFEQRCSFPTRFHCYRTGLGADNMELYEALTRRGGGIFNCFNEADLAQAALAHRSQCLKVDSVRFSGAVQASDVLVAGRQAAVYPGGNLIVAAKMAKAGTTTAVVEGTFQGQKWVQEYPVEITAYSDLAPRGWGEIAIASLLALNDPKLDGLVTAYCQQFSIGSRVASFLVLENEADYKRFNLEDERGKTHAGDLGTFLDNAWRGLAQAISSRAAFAQFLDRIDPRVNLRHGPNGAYVTKLLDLLKDDDYELPVTSVTGRLLHKSEVPAAYLAKRDVDLREAGTYLTEARRRADGGDASGAVRALSSVIELYPARGDALRLVGYRLLDLKLPVLAANLFRQVQAQRPFEPHSYRDMARSLEDSGRYGLAALQYEIVLAGTWHNRFHESLKLVVQEEYARMMRDAIAKKAVGPDLANHFGERLEKMDPAKMQADLRVTISWNTDNTDVDLWVIEPSGEKCFYQNRNTKAGGGLTEDQTQGYGPERYQIKNAQRGLYRVIVHYFRPNPNLLAGETHVNVVITEHAGTPQERTERKTVILRRHNEEAEVGQIEF
jgi:hypothetical protein